ncbi:hypothetical protein TIFTF001_021045 [Ficus carica]|uniref:Uncharacterized protein n=1 Tax=Ficus carica TaxID=3494 RepID=A0AA88DD86_FICCA|nr:hypothetical protein TIFTF001_021045 [Ficus carica]
MNEYNSAFEQEEDDIYSENEHSDNDSYLAKAVVAVTASRRNRRRDPQPMHNSRLTCSIHVEEILNGHEKIIQGLISMKTETFKALSGHVDVNADYVLADGVDGTGPSTGTQQHVSTKGAMNQMRDMMADDKWDRYQSSPWYKFT